MASKKNKVPLAKFTQADLDLFMQCAKSPFEFAKHVKLIHPIRGKVPFDLYPYQQATLMKFLVERFNVILKFRQAGLTELISLFCLWMAMFHPYKNIVIISIKDRVAKKVLRKIKFMYKNLPEALKVPIVNGKGEDLGTVSEIEFSNGSMITSIPTTEDAGRSEAVSLLVIDEAAIVRWAEKIWAGLWPTLSTGGRAIVNSTAYGIGNFFHKLFVTALAGGNKFNAIRLHWQMHPERDMAWYLDQRAILGPKKTAQEIDGDFLSSGNTVFDMVDIREIEELIKEGIVIHDEALDKDIDYGVKELRENGQLRIYEYPVPGERYFIGADISSGRSQDYSTFCILNKWGNQMASYKGKIPVDQFADLLDKHGKAYNNALIAPESNDIGLAVTMQLQREGYLNLYYTKSLLKEKGSTKTKVDLIPGWLTTKKNRPIIIAGLEEDIRNCAIFIKCPYFCTEAETFIYDDMNRPVAKNKHQNKGEAADEMNDDEVYSDDMIFATAIANHIRKERAITVTAIPR